MVAAPAAAHAQSTPPAPAPPTSTTVPAPVAPAVPVDRDDGPDARPGESGNLLGFEEYGAYPMSRYVIGCDEGAWNHLSRKAWCFAQQMPFEGSKLLVGLSSSMISWAMTFQLAEGLNQAAGSMASTYETRLIGGLELRHLAWMLTCFWVGWLVLRSRASQAFGELATTLVIAALGSFIIANPAGYLSGAADVVRNTNNAVLDAMGGGDQGADQVAVDVGSQFQASFIAEPYDIINWGSSLDAPGADPKCAAARNVILDKGPFGPGSDTPRELMTFAGCADQADFNHDPGGDRTVASLACFLAAFLVLVLMCLLAATLLASQLMLVVLWALSPLAIVAGIAPGGTRHVLWRWMSANVTVFLVNVAAAFTLGFVTVMSTQVLEMTEGTSIVRRLGLLDLVVVTGLVFRKRITHAAHNVGSRTEHGLAQMVPARAGQSVMRPPVIAGATGYAFGRQLNEATAEIPGGRRLRSTVDPRVHTRHRRRSPLHPFGGAGGGSGRSSWTSGARRHATQSRGPLGAGAGGFRMDERSSPTAQRLRPQLESRLGSRPERTVGITSNRYQHLMLVTLVGTGSPSRSTPLDGDGAPEALRSGLTGVPSKTITAWAPVLAVIAIAVICVAMVAGGLCRRRALRQRDAGRLLLPSPKFEPTAEEVERFAAVLTRSHRATRLPGSRSAHAVRIRVGSGLDGLVEYRLEGHHRSRSVLTMAGYDQVDNQPLDDDEVQPS